MRRTFPHCHGRDYTLDSIFAFIAVFTVEIDAELVVFSFTWSLSTSESAHDPRLGGVFAVAADGGGRG